MVGGHLHDTAAVAVDDRPYDVAVEAAVVDDRPYDVAVEVAVVCDLLP